MIPTLRTPLRTRIIPSRDSCRREAPKVGRVENSSSTSAVYTGLVNPRVHRAHGRPSHPHLPRHIASPGISLPAEVERWLPLNEGEVQTGRPSPLPQAHSTLLATQANPTGGTGACPSPDAPPAPVPPAPACLAPMPPPSVLQPLPPRQVHALSFASREAASAAVQCAQPSSHRNNVPAALGLNCLHMFTLLHRTPEPPKENTARFNTVIIKRKLSPLRSSGFDT